MKTSALATAKRPWPRWLALAAIACFAVGIVLVFVRRSPSLLADARGDEIPRRETAWQQLYHAKLSDTEAAWRKVWEYFPAHELPENRFTEHLAKQGLARYYIWQTGRYDQALPLLEDLAELPESETSFRAFGLAGICIVRSVQDKRHDAIATFARLTPAMIDALDPEMRQLLKERMSSSRSALGAAAQTRFRQLDQAPDNATGG